MTITNKQKQFILLNHTKKSIDEISLSLKVSSKEVEEYLTQRNLLSVTKANNKDFNISKKTENLVYLCILTLVVLIVYFLSFNNELVSDDREVIIGLEQQIKSGEFLLNNPLMILRNVQYVIAYQLGGLTPIFYRMFNIAFHVGFVLVTFNILRKFTSNKHLPFFVSLMVAVHPIAVEPVAWISGGIYVQAAFFTSISFYLYILFKENLNKKFLILSSIFFLIGVSSSEKVIVFPFVLVLYEIAFGNLKKTYKYLISFFVISAFWGFLMLQSLSARLDYLMLANGTDQRFYFNNPFIQIPTALTSYFHLFLWPDKLNLYQSDLNLSTFTIIRNNIVSFSYLAIALFFYKRNKIIFFWMMFFVLSLLVTLNPFGLSWVFAERYAYFGSIGIYFVIVSLVLYFFNYLNAKKGAYIFLTVVIIALSIRSVVRIGDWKNEETLWTATAKYAKTDAKSHNNLGHVLAKKGDIEGAAASFSKAIELSPGYADPYHNLANLYIQIGNLEEAKKILIKALELNPNLWQSNQNLASIYLNEKKFEAAKEYFEKVIKIKPDYFGAYMGLGMVYIETKEFSKSTQYLSKALELSPDNEQIKNLLNIANNK